MAKNEYTRITRHEFESALEKSELDFTRYDYDWTYEWVYDAISENATFLCRVYSSIDKRTNESRDKDSDSIKIAVLHTKTQQPVFSEKRTNRIETWEKNLLNKLNNVKTKQSDVDVCSECGSIMVIRESSSGDRFKGCTGYPDCKNTKSI